LSLSGDINRVQRLQAILMAVHITSSLPNILPTIYKVI